VLNLMKKVAKSIASFSFDAIKLPVWMFLFALVVFLNVKFFKGERGRNGKSQKSFSR